MDIHDQAQKTIQYGKANGKSNADISAAVTKLYARHDASVGQENTQVQPKTVAGKAISGVEKVGSAIVGGVEKTYDAEKGFVQGKPAFPATGKDIGQNGGPQDIVKILGNTFSDAPAVLKGMVDIVAHPINSAKGIAEYYGNIASTSFNAIKESIKTGNMTAINQAIDDAETSVIDHPLQAILAFEGAKGAVEGAVDLGKDVQEKGVKQTATDKATALYEKGKDIAKKVGSAYETAKNVVTGNGSDTGFKSKSSIHNATIKAAANLDDVLNKQKEVDDLTEKVKAFADKTKAESEANKGNLDTKGKEIKQTKDQITQKSAEQRQAELQLKVAQNELADIQEQQKQISNQAATSTQSEMSRNGFGSIPDLSKAVTDFFKSAKDKLSKVYDDKLGNAKISLGSVFSGIGKFQDYLRGISDTKTLKAIQPMIDNLKIRDIVSQAGDDNSKLTQMLGKSDVDPRLWHDLDFDRIRQEYPPLTSDNIKGTRNNIEATIRENNTDALKNFGTNVISAFKDTFRNAIRDNFGQDTLDKLDANDKNWSEIMKNPLSAKENPTLADIQKNWKSFTQNATQLPEGDQLVKKIQNYAGEQVLDAAESRGEYSVKKIETGIKKYADILGDTVTKQLRDVADLIDQKTPEQTAKEQQVDTAKQKIDTAKQDKQSLQDKKSAQVADQKELTDRQKEIDATSKSIGTDSSEIMDRIKGIDTMDGLKKFLADTGKTIEDVRSVVLQSIIENVDKEAGKDENAPFDVNRISSYISQVNKIGGDGPEGQAVNDEMLGKDGRKAFNDVKEKVDEYNKLKSAKSKTAAARLVQASFGALLLTIGFGRFFGARQLLQAFSPAGEGKFTSLSDPEGRQRPVPQGQASNGILGLVNRLIQNPLIVTGGTQESKKKDGQ